MNDPALLIEGEPVALLPMGAVLEALADFVDGYRESGAEDVDLDQPIAALSFSDPARGLTFELRWSPGVLTPDHEGAGEEPE